MKLRFPGGFERNFCRRARQSNIGAGSQAAMFFRYRSAAKRVGSVSSAGWSLAAH